MCTTHQTAQQSPWKRALGRASGAPASGELLRTRSVGKESFNATADGVQTAAPSRTGPDRIPQARLRLQRTRGQAGMWGGSQRGVTA